MTQYDIQTQTGKLLGIWKITIKVPGKDLKMEVEDFIKI